MASQYGFNPPPSNALNFIFDTDTAYIAPAFIDNSSIIQMMDGIIETKLFDYFTIIDKEPKYSYKLTTKLSDSFIVKDSTSLAPLLRFTDSLKISDELKVNGVFSSLFKDNFSIKDDLKIQSKLLFVLREEIELTDDLRLNGLIIAKLFDKVKIQDYLVDEKLSSEDDESSYDTYFMNFKLQAFSRYKGLSFNSAVKHNGKYLISNQDGIFENDGDVDDLKPIASSFKTGLLRIGGSTQARIDKAFLAIKNDGNMKIKVIGSDGLEFTYKLEQYSTTIKEKSVSFGKGRGDGMARKCSYFQFEIDNDGGTNFELDNLQVYKLVTSNKTN